MSRYKINSKIFGKALLYGTNRKNFIVLTIVKKRLKSYELGIICGIPLQEYLKMSVKKVNILRTLNSKALIQLKLCFSIYKNSIYYLCPNVINNQGGLDT